MGAGGAARSEESLKVTRAEAVWWEDALARPRRLRPFLSAIAPQSHRRLADSALHCVSPTAFARGETPFRMTAYLSGALRAAGEPAGYQV